MSLVHELPLPALERLVEQATGTPPPLVLNEIVGGASVRRFFRVNVRGGGTVIAMFVPVQSHEFEKAGTAHRRWPFLEIRELLETRGVRVPRLIAENCDESLILVEDLGETLAQHLVEHPEDREALYVAAVRDLAHAQRALLDLPEDSIVRQRAFDEDLLAWELDHFREWALDARGCALTSDERGIFDTAARFLSQTIAAWPRGFVHRDYQSRNLMVVRDDGRLRLAWIDFQDAMLGPRVYDLCALLGDSYQSFTPEFVEARLAEFATHLELAPEERDALRREFFLVMVQRKLKDAGRFVYIDRKLGNPSFLQFFESTVEKAQRALDEVRNEPPLAALSDLLERFFPRST